MAAMTARLFPVALLVLVAVPGLRSVADAPRAVESSTTLAVEGRQNTSPAVAAIEKTVVVAWGAAAGAGGDVFAAVSHDGGTTFGAPLRVNSVAGEAQVGGERGPRLALVPRGSSPPAIVVIWTAKGQTTSVKTARSIDGGRSFGRGIPLQAPAALGNRGWPALSADATGRVQAIWLDHRAAIKSGMTARGNSDGEAHHHHDADGAEMAQRSALYYWNGAGERELLRGVCYCCKTALATSADGTVYAAWRHVYPGNIRDIAFTMSRDGGRTFTQPVRVSEDRWQLNGCPEDGPAMVADSRGTIHLAWPTVVSGPSPRKGVFYASSTDGRRFTPRVDLAPSSPDMSHPQITVSPSGDVVVLWDELTAGTRRLYYARRSAGGARFAAPAPLADVATASYAAAAFSGDTLVVAWTSGNPSQIKVRRVR